MRPGSPVRAGELSSCFFFSKFSRLGCGSPPEDLGPLTLILELQEDLFSASPQTILLDRDLGSSGVSVFARSTAGRSGSSLRPAIPISPRVQEPPNTI